MAITFPRDFPLGGLFTNPAPFALVYQQSQAITGGGAVNAADLGPAYWSCEFRTKCLRAEDFEEWQAWGASLRGGLRLFKGRPPGRRWPLAHRKGFAGMLYSAAQWSGLGNLSVIGASRDTITVNQIANGLVLKPGDWLSIPVGTRQHLHKITVGATSAGNAITVDIEPAIRPGVVTGIAVRFDTPFCDMVLKDGAFMAAREGRGGSISFTGLQVL